MIIAEQGTLLQKNNKIRTFLQSEKGSDFVVLVEMKWIELSTVAYNKTTDLLFLFSNKQHLMLTLK